MKQINFNRRGRCLYAIGQIEQYNNWLKIDENRCEETNVFRWHRPPDKANSFIVAVPFFICLYFYCCKIAGVLKDLCVFYCSTAVHNFIVNFFDDDHQYTNVLM